MILAPVEPLEVFGTKASVLIISSHPIQTYLDLAPRVIAKWAEKFPFSPVSQASFVGLGSRQLCDELTLMGFQPVEGTYQKKFSRTMSHSQEQVVAFKEHATFLDSQDHFRILLHDGAWTEYQMVLRDSGAIPVLAILGRDEGFIDGSSIQDRLDQSPWLTRDFHAVFESGPALDYSWAATPKGGVL